MSPSSSLFLLIALVITTLTAGCNNSADDSLAEGYTSVSSISQGGFARNEAELQDIQGQEIRLWGGDGPTANTWRFNLKGQPNDAAGQSFSVQVPNDGGRDELLQAFLTDARAQRPTKVFVTGRLFTFDAPTNATTYQGIYLEVQSSQDVSLDSSKHQQHE